jgi:CBS domain-containing protein
MTLASELVTLEDTASIATANNVANEAGVRHLLLVSGSRLTGVVCRCDLFEESYEGESVLERAVRCPWVIGPETTIGDTASLMRDKKIGILPVVYEREILGVITRGDLRRLGIDEAFLETASCVACGSKSGVRHHPSMANVEFCLECLEAEREPIEWCELGVGD